MPSASSLSDGRQSVLRENSTGIAVSVAMHAILLAALMHHWVPEKQEKAARPQFINAQLLQMKPAAAQPQQPKAVEAPKPKPEPKVDAEAVKRQEEQKRQEQVRRQEEVKRKQEEVKRQEEVRRQQEVKRKEEEKRQLEIKRQEDAKRQQKAKEEAERKQQEEAKRQEAKRQEEQKRQEELKRQQQLKAEAERKRQEELKRQEEQKRQQELAKQRELEQALAMEEEAMAAEEMGAQVGTYVDYMASLIASNWSRPPGTRNGTQVLLQIRLGSAGRVVGVQVAKSSGNPAFDRSAEQAVWKVGQFTRLQEMDSALYQKQFRVINILFNPQDLRM